MAVDEVAPSRRFRWVSSLDASKRGLLDQLQDRMARYYATESSYYSDIDFTKDNWRDDNLYRYISVLADQHRDVVEIGCGRANILRHHRNWSRATQVSILARRFSTRLGKVFLERVLRL
jgi:hypothetical protein